MKKKKKKCYVNNIFRNNLTDNNLIPRIYCEKYYESNTSQPKKKITTIFTIVELANLLLSIYYINRCEKFCQIFCVYRLSKLKKNCLIHVN